MCAAEACGAVRSRRIAVSLSAAAVVLLEILAETLIDIASIAIGCARGVTALPEATRERIAALPERGRQRVIALLQTLITLLRGLLGRVVAEEIKTSPWGSPP